MDVVDANLVGVETPPPADVRPDGDFIRGLAYSVMFSIPLWGAIIIVTRLVF